MKYIGAVSDTDILINLAKVNRLVRLLHNCFAFTMSAEEYIILPKNLTIFIELFHDLLYNIFGRKIKLRRK